MSEQLLVCTPVVLLRKSCYFAQGMLEEACQQAGLHDFVMSLPFTYDTQCGEKGVQLSRNQTWRVAVARAIVRKPSILLIDEVPPMDLDSEVARTILIFCTIVIGTLRYTLVGLWIHGYPSIKLLYSRSAVTAEFGLQDSTKAVLENCCRGRTVLLATQNYDVAQYAQRILLIADGQVAESWKLDSIGNW